jgi:hypothetical protein
MLVCPEHEYGFVGLLIIVDEKPQNDLDPRDVDSRCGESNADIAEEQFIHACGVPEPVLGVVKLAVQNFLERWVAAFGKKNKYCFYGVAELRIVQ